MCSRLKLPFCHGLMIPTLQPYIDALRSELQQYGALLALLEVQDGCPSNSLLSLTREIETLSRALDTAQNCRASSQKQLACALGIADHTALPKILPSLPEEYRPLVSALAYEVNELLLRLQHCAELNRAHLQQSLELLQRIVTDSSPPVAEKHFLPGVDSTPPIAAAA